MISRAFLNRCRRLSMAATATALLMLLAASLATAAAPPAAIDQYRPNAPGATDDVPDGSGPADGATGGEAPAGEAIAADGSGVPGTTSSEDPETGRIGAGGVSDGGADGGRDSSGANEAVADAGGPSLGGYPLTWGIVIALAGLAVAIAFALGLRAWRRYRGGIALPKPG